ncbi:hypothetical protein, partial [Yersinia rohdei]|uniref:hypothetical protein n=1 Tax=Yersinia rohdei TaxID=29485 RepID=UPI001C979632
LGFIQVVLSQQRQAVSVNDRHSRYSFKYDSAKVQAYLPTVLITVLPIIGIEPQSFRKITINGRINSITR